MALRHLISIFGGFAILLFFEIAIAPASGISCYAFDPVNESISLEMDCTQCRKSFMMFNVSDSVETTQRWHCEKDVKVSSCASAFHKRENVAASYRADGSSETRLCTCCTDYCNGGDDFCEPDDPIVERIKELVDKPHAPYEVFEEVNGHLIQKSTTPLPENQEVMSCYNSSDSSANKTVLIYGCNECRKTVTRLHPEQEFEISWQCVTPFEYQATIGDKPCTPFVSATVSTDGFSSIQTYCSCCHDGCNNAEFCMFNMFTSSSPSRPNARPTIGDIFNLNTPTKITVSAVLLVTFLLLASQRIYTAVTG